MRRNLNLRKLYHGVSNPKNRKKEKKTKKWPKAKKTKTWPSGKQKPVPEDEKEEIMLQPTSKKNLKNLHIPKEKDETEIETKPKRNLKD